MIEKFLGFLKTMQESHTEYHNFNLFSINCQRRTSIMWQLFLYRAAEKKNQRQNYSCETWQMLHSILPAGEADNSIYLCCRAARPTLLAWGLERSLSFPPELSQLAAGCTVAMTRGSLNIILKWRLMQIKWREISWVYSVLRLKWNKEIELHTFKIGSNSFEKIHQQQRRRKQWIKRTG